MNKTIFISGGAGYVGTALIDLALKRKYKVICYDILIYSDNPIENFKKNKNFTLIKGDIRDRKKLRESLKDVDYVVNLAAIVGDKPCQVAPKSTYQINYLGNQFLLEESKKNKIKKYLFASTCSNYGITDPNSFADEKSKLNPVSLYAEIKIDSEKIVKEFNEKNFSTTNLRFATAYGVSKRTRFDLAVNSFAYEAYKEKKLMVFAEDTWRPYIHVYDMGYIILDIINSKNKNFAGETFNAGYTNQNYMKKEIVNFFKKKLHSLEVNTLNSIDDPRNYRVSFKKLEKILKIKNKFTINKGINELFENFKSGNLTFNDYNTNSLEMITNFYNEKEKSLYMNNI